MPPDGRHRHAHAPRSPQDDEVEVAQRQPRRDLREQHRGARAAAEMPDEVLDAIKGKIKASGIAQENLQIETVLDPKLLGGFVLEFDNKRYDASALHKLNQLKSEFSKNLYIKEF